MNFFNPPKNSDKYQWTKHAAHKLQQYGLSAQRITRVIRAPKRIEKGIAKNTVAVMQPSSTKKVNGKETWSQEIWAMYQTRGAGNYKSEIRNSKQILNPKFENYKLLTTNNKQIKIISAWRYPGISPKNNPIPQEIFDEIANATH